MQAREPFGNAPGNHGRRRIILLAIIGGIMVAAGLGGLFYCILQGYRIRGAGLAPAEVTARLRALIAINLASVGAAGLGLACLTLYFVLR